MDLSIVLPVYREKESLRELAERCSSAAQSTGLDYQVLFVDDASGDAGPDLIRTFPPSLRARVLELERNRGQFCATQAGLSDAQGAIVVVLDGDLQDPPEVIPELIAEHQRSQAPHGRRVTFAVKCRRDDPTWFRLGHAAFRSLQRRLGGGPPEHSGSYCAMDREVARTVARVRLRDPNLAWVLAALGYSGGSVQYAKQRRADGASRMGPLRLSQEALTSLFISTRLGRRWLRRRLRP